MAEEPRGETTQTSALFTVHCPLSTSERSSEPKHFSARAFQSNPELPENWSQDAFLDRLRDKIQHADINQIKQDVIPFIKDLSHLDIWSTDYFLQLSNLITFA
jgi:hypothetical protein